MLKRGSADGLSEVNAPGHCGLVNMSSVIEKQEKPDASKQNPMNHLLERRGTSVTVRQLQLYDSSLGRGSSVKLSILVDTSVISISASDTNLEHLLICSLTMCSVFANQIWNVIRRVRVPQIASRLKKCSRLFVTQLALVTETPLGLKSWLKAVLPA